jgi:uncharacterized UPF0160 family protein
LKFLSEFVWPVGDRPQPVRIDHMAARQKTVAVHDQNWHADDCLSVYFLKNTEEFKDAIVKRTRNPAELEHCDAVCDTGGQYDPERRRYDHHQPGFNKTFPGYDIRLSACGTIYYHFGDEILRNILQKNGREIGPHTPFLKEMMYQEFILEIDASDNGLTQFPDDATPEYMVHTGISQRIALTNTTDGNDGDAAFARVSAMIGREFERKLLRIFDCDVPALVLLEAALNDRAHFGGRVIAFDSACPAGKHIKRAERAHECDGAVLFFVMPNGAGEWAVHAIGDDAGNLRKELPETFWTLSGEALVARVPGALRIHRKVAIFAEKEPALAFAIAVASDA